jgi:uncharacterized protein
MLITLVSAAAAAVCGCSDDRKPGPPATVTLGGHTWTVELATTQRQRYQGLSDRYKLDANAGMLFIYPSAHGLDFCMRDCYIALDIAFLDANGVVIRTYTMPTEPRGREKATYPSVDPATYALELNAGELKKAGIKEGDQAKFFNVSDPAKAEPGP